MLQEAADILLQAGRVTLQVQGTQEREETAAVEASRSRRGKKRRQRI